MNGKAPTHESTSFFSLFFFSLFLSHLVHRVGNVHHIVQRHCVIGMLFFATAFGGDRWGSHSCGGGKRRLNRVIVKGIGAEAELNNVLQHLLLRAVDNKLFILKRRRRNLALRHSPNTLEAYNIQEREITKR